MIFPYGKKIKDKIDIEKKEKEVNVFDWVNGKDLVILAQIDGKFVKYDNSYFDDKSSMKLLSEKDGTMKAVFS